MACERINKHIDLCFTLDNEVLTPFYFYVSVDSWMESTIEVPFNFAQLPRELQIMIYEQCSPSTLFQLMRTTSQIRYDVENLFWAQTEPWYTCGNIWSEEEGGDISSVDHCLDFAARVQQVSIDIPDSWDYAYPRKKNHAFALRYSRLLYQSAPQLWLGKIERFWTNFQCHFPQAKRVVLNSRSLTRDYDLVVQRGPPGVKVLFSAWKWEKHSCAPLTLWESRKDYGSGKIEWDVIDDDFRPQRVLMPLAAVSGIAGQMLKFERIQKCIDLEYGALHEYRIRLLENHHFKTRRSTPLECPSPDCSERFVKWENWSRHVRMDCEDRYEVIKHRSHISIVLPDATEQEVLNIQNAMEKKEDDLRQHKKLYLNSLGELGSEEWTRNRNEFYKQLKTDPLLAGNTNVSLEL
jgi:hypothetical protein